MKITKVSRFWIGLGLSFAMARCGSDPSLSLVLEEGSEAGNGGQAGEAGARGQTSGGGPIVNIPEGGESNQGGEMGTAGSCGNDCAVGCGNGIVEDDEGETCDDGNSRPGDGCSGICLREPNYECPDPGEPCVFTLVCGDGQIGGTETCDDGNDEAGDGCDDDCRVEPGFACSTPGEPCEEVDTEECGDGAVNAGEACDDGNMEDGDGCPADCSEVEPGYNCPIPGEYCEIADYCGDGEVSLALSEQCDDGNMDGGDGCSPQCFVETGFRCPTPGEPCESTVVCGDGVILGDEQCDDGDDPPASGDGCDDECNLEDGWVCPPRAVCRAASCGDGIVAGREQCDDGNPDSDDGCSATCRLEEGFKCDDESPSICVPTVCGDNVKEGLEQCDDGNLEPYDGCTATCHKEPTCANGAACAPVCGDGIKFPEEDCDDGGIAEGDGCAADCSLEEGYDCTTADETPDLLTLPLILRDFKRGAPFSQTSDPGISQGHTDFQWGGGFSNSTYNDPDTNLDDNWTDAPSGSTGDAFNNGRNGNIRARDWNLGGLEYGIAADNLGNDKKPVFRYTGDASDDGNMGNCPLDWGELIRDSQGFCVEQVQNATSFSRWFHDVDAYNNTYVSSLFLDRSGNTYVYDSDFTRADGTSYPNGNGYKGFWPLDDAPGVSKYSQCSISGQGTPPTHNFHFSSEVHHWFQFDSGSPPTLTFTGDDDVFVYIKGRLVVDLGGIHAREQGSVTLDSNGDAAMDLPGGGNDADIALALQNGKIYEVIVFQAERNTCESNYRLEIENFNLAKSECVPDCGDGVVTPDEACDDGVNNGDYGACEDDCSLAPFCGDGVVEPGEEDCDLGINIDTYQTTPDACAPGCVPPPYCGDGTVQGAYEACDLGDDNDDDAYGPNLCTEVCRPAPYCGDRRVDVDQGEVCDDGAMNGSGLPGSCRAGCTGRVPQPNCGDGNLDSGEACDEGDDNGEPGSGCDVNCRVSCGNGVVDEDEECDDGKNDGSYGTCTEDCEFAPYCGDGQTDGPEECDEGDDNEDDPYGEGLCTTGCRLAPYCGDRRVQTRFNEECDGGGTCSATCKVTIPQ